MVTKTIIANYGDPNLGKTKSVVLAYKKLKDKGERKVICDPEYNNGDLCAIITINNVKVGFSSLGDSRSCQKEWLDSLVKEDCTIILTACHHSGATVTVIEDTARANGYRIYWTSNARLFEDRTNPRVAPKGICDRFNEQWAEEIANLIESWCYA